MNNILLVEDDWGLASHWQALLEDAGHRVIHELTVEAAIEVLESTKIDLLITDILIESDKGHEADHGGLEIVTYVAINLDPLPRIIVISGAEGQSNFVDRNFDRLDAMSALRKPVSDIKFLQAVETSLANPISELTLDPHWMDEFKSQITPQASGGSGAKKQPVLELLQATQFRLRQTQFALDNAPDGVFWIDDSGNIIYTNEWNCEQLGYTRGELLSKSVVDINPRIESPEFFHFNILPQILKSGSKFEEQHQRKDGSLFPVEISAHAVNYEGEKFICAFVRDITDRKNREQELIDAKMVAEEGERRFRTLANNTSPLIWMTELDSTCSWLNKRWLEYSGRTLEEETGFGWLDTVHPVDRNPTKEKYLAAFEKEIDFEVDYRLRRHDGVYRWHKANATVRRDTQGKFLGFTGISFDTHDARMHLIELENSRIALHEANNSLQAMLDLLGTSDGVWDWKVGTPSVVYAPGFRKLLGFAGDDVNSFPNRLESMDARIHPDDQADFWSSVELSFKNREAFSHEYRLRNVENDYFWVRSRGMANFDDQGNAVRLVGSTYDISDTKLAELELEREREALAESNAELTQFAYVASHDLQEPLRAIGGFLQLLELRHGDALSEQARGYIQKSVDGAARMSQLIRDLLRYSRITRNDEEFQEVNLNEIVSEAIADFEHLFVDTPTKIVVEELPTIQGAKPLLLQLFRNLVGNAIKYRSQAEPEIHISAKRKAGFHVIRFQDNGIGIAERHQKQIFDLFKRLHHHHEYEGTGIGLSICKKAVEKHGGTITVDSVEGMGSCFIIRFPIR